MTGPGGYFRPYLPGTRQNDSVAVISFPVSLHDPAGMDRVRDSLSRSFSAMSLPVLRWRTRYLR